MYVIQTPFLPFPIPTKSPQLTKTKDTNQWNIVATVGKLTECQNTNANNSTHSKKIHTTKQRPKLTNTNVSSLARGHKHNRELHCVLQNLEQKLDT